MFLNETKGSFGMFSRAGRNSTEKFHILVKKEEILSGNQRKARSTDMFGDPRKQENSEDEEDDLLKIESKKKMKSPSIVIETKKKIYSSVENMSEDKKKIIEERKKKVENPSCTKYNPKYNYIKTKIVSAPNWNSTVRKNFSAKSRKEETPEFYLSHEMNLRGRNFIDMSRQTNRPEFIKKKYHSNENIQEEEKSESKIDKKLRKYTRIQAPDFKKSMTREKLDKIYGDKKGVIPFSMPNYDFVQERPVMLVKYEKMKNKKERKEKPNERYSDYDIDKILHKINNYKKPVTPDFKRMISRPNTEGPLPVYMKKLFNRQSANIFTENSLKMNRFSDGKFPKTQTSFWPKKTFNKIINLNILTSKKFKESLGIFEKEDGKKEELLAEIKNSMKFYNQNYEELIKETNIKKFDNVTFKSLQRPSRIDSAQLDKLLVRNDKDSN